MRNFPNAETARHLTKLSRSYEALVRDADEAILKASNRSTMNYAEIGYEGIDAETHAKFHAFITAHGYSGSKVNLVGNVMVYRIRW